MGLVQHSSILLIIIYLHVSHGLLYPRESETREIKSLDGLWKFRTQPLLEPELGFDSLWFENVTMWNSDMAVRDMPVPASYNDITTEAALRDFVGRILLVNYFCNIVRRTIYVLYVQGVSFEKWIFQMAVAPKRCISDPMLVKPKCV